MDSNTISVILLIIKETGLEIERLIRDAQNEALDRAQRQHALNIAQAKVISMRKSVNDALNVVDMINKNNDTEWSCE